LEIILIILILIIFGILFFSQKKHAVKNTTVKKEEIINKYENDLKSLLNKYKKNKAKQLEEKKIFLQNCNSELARNIFFTHEEAVKVIERLLKI